MHKSFSIDFTFRPAIAFDLDDTLVHATPIAPKKVNVHDYFTITVHRRKMYVQKRPNLHNFLERIAKLYDIYFFTSSTKGSFVENLAERTSFDLFPCPKNK